MRTMNKRVVILVAGAAVAVAATLFTVNFLRGDNVAPLSLDTPSPTAGTTAGGDPAGTWTVGEGSKVGYRVREKLAVLTAESDAVGRTSDVTGSLTIERGDDETLTATALMIEVDMTTLTSDESRRDRRMRTMGLETNTFPKASFKLTNPVAVPKEAESGSIVKLTLTGSLTLHGETRDVSIPVDARGSGDRMEVSGRLLITMADYRIDPPNIGGFVSVHDSGTLEFTIILTRS